MLRRRSCKRSSARPRFARRAVLRRRLGSASASAVTGALVYDVGGRLYEFARPSTRPSEHTVLGFAVPDIASVMEVCGAWRHV